MPVGSGSIDISVDTSGDTDSDMPGNLIITVADTGIGIFLTGHVVIGFHQFFQRTYYERHRCSDFMRYVGEEAQFRLIYLFGVFLLHLFVLLLYAYACHTPSDQCYADNGIESDETTIIIDVAHPWWTAWWMKLIYIIVLAGIALVAWRMARIRLKEKHEEVQRYIFRSRGRIECLAKVVDKRHYLDFGKPELHLVFVNLSYVHQLIYQAQYAVGIALYESVLFLTGHVVIGFHQFFQRTYYERHRCAPQHQYNQLQRT